MRVDTALPLRQSSSKNACIGTMQRCPASQASRRLLDVVTVSLRAFTSLGERSFASDADFTQRGTSPNCPIRRSSTGSDAAASPCARWTNSPGWRGHSSRPMGASGAGTPNTSV